MPASSSTADDPWARENLLSFDGGGIRGYASLLTFQKIMDEVAKIEQEFDTTACRKYLPRCYFNYIAGSSTGGLIAIMLGRLGMTTEECLKAYEVIADKAFGNPRSLHLLRGQYKYDHKPLENAIKDIVQEHTGQANAMFEQPRQDMCRTSIRIPYLLRSYHHPKTGFPDERNPDEHVPNGRKDFKIFEVARATSAYPPLFAPAVLETKDANFHFLDGGLGANNPSEEAQNSIRQLNNDENDAVQLLLSIGTGTPAARTQLPTSFFSKMWQLCGTVTSIATDTYPTHRRVEREMKDHGYYHRFNPDSGVGEIETGACEGVGGAKTFQLLRTRHAQYTSKPEVAEEIANVARDLVNIRRQRSRGPDLDRWERYCHGVEYACDRDSCYGPGEKFDRQGFRQHVEESHPGFCSPATIESLLDAGKRFPTMGFAKVSEDTLVGR